MKHLSLFILTVFTTVTVAAKCAGSGIYLLSKNSTLNKNGLIILEFYAGSRSIIQDLNKKYPIYLQSSNGKITLMPVEILKGEMQVTQVILKASAELAENAVYILHIDNLSKYERLQHYNERSQRWEPITFKISSSADTEAPVLKGQPAEQKKTMVGYGCGPARWVYFTLAGQDKSELFVKASVRNKTTGLTTNYILLLENGIAKVGHGMCSGAFHFDDGNNFEITFQLFDQSGNKSSLTKSISFTSPNASTNDE